MNSCRNVCSGWLAGWLVGRDGWDTGHSGWVGGEAGGASITSDAAIFLALHRDDLVERRGRLVWGLYSKFLCGLHIIHVVIFDSFVRGSKRELNLLRIVIAK